MAAILKSIWQPSHIISYYSMILPDVENMGKDSWFTVLGAVDMNILTKMEYFGCNIWFQDGGQQEVLIFGVYFFNDPWVSYYHCGMFYAFLKKCTIILLCRSTIAKI